MRYIEKHYGTLVVVRHKEELAKKQLDEESLLNANVYSGKTGSQLYEMVRDLPTMQGLKEQMYAEQGGVCCYCGMKLEHPFDPQYRVEHVLPKDSHRELVGEYKNLLLSCRATAKEMKLRADKTLAKAKRKEFIHCDEAKGSQEITYSPLNKSCENAFRYDLKGQIHPADKKADEDIKTLGLAGKYLKERRKTAIETLVLGTSVLSDEDLIAFQAGLLSRNADGKYAEFYFVIADAINQLLPTS